MHPNTTTTESTMDLDEPMEDFVSKYYLDTFDKINLAYCAMKRAQMNSTNHERFIGDYESARLWQTHRISRHQINDRAVGFIN